MGHPVMKIRLTRTAQDSAADYVDALIEACQTAGVDPVRVLIDTDAYPQVTKQIEMAEFLVGWFHGVAEAIGVHVESLWEALAPSARKPESPKTALTRAPHQAPAKRSGPRKERSRLVPSIGKPDVKMAAQAMLEAMRDRRSGQAR